MMSRHTVVLAAALLALLCLAAVCARRFEVLAWRRDWARRAQLDAPMLHVLDQHLTVPQPAACCGCGVSDPMDSWPAIEQVIAELRRLSRARQRGLVSESGLWGVAVERAYDRWLQLACHYVSVSHYLFKLTDMDRELERVRIEAELTAAGLPIGE